MARVLIVHVFQANDYRDGSHETQNLDTVIMSTPDTPPELLLESHKTFAKAIRNW